VHHPTNARNKVQFKISIKTPTCLDTGVQSSGSYATKDYKPDMLGVTLPILKFLKC